jgi:hypothetical protein
MHFEIKAALEALFRQAGDEEQAVGHPGAREFGVIHHRLCTT